MPTIAAAATAEGSVPANKSSVIYAFYEADPQNCNAIGRPTTSVPTKPQHGRVEFLYRDVKVQHFSTPCNGKMRKAMMVIYTPAPGFHGTDTLEIGLRFPESPGYVSMSYRGKSFIIHVK
jgi:hypothetical protein